jgi:hypothetical protein
MLLNNTAQKCKKFSSEEVDGRLMVACIEPQTVTCGSRS